MVIFMTKKGEYSRLLEPIKSNVSLERPNLNTSLIGNRLEFYPDSESSPSEISKAEEFLINLFSTEKQIISKSVYQLAEAEGIDGETIKKAKLRIPGLSSKKINNVWHYVIYRQGG